MFRSDFASLFLLLQKVVSFSLTYFFTLSKNNVLLVTSAFAVLFQEKSNSQVFIIIIIIDVLYFHMVYDCFSILASFLSPTNSLLVDYSCATPSEDRAIKLPLIPRAALSFIEMWG